MHVVKAASLTTDSLTCLRGVIGQSLRDWECLRELEAVALLAYLDSALLPEPVCLAAAVLLVCCIPGVLVFVRVGQSLLCTT